MAAADVAGVLRGGVRSVAVDAPICMTPEAWRTLSKRERRNWLLTWAGRRSNRWIAQRIGCTPRQVYNRCNHYGIAPTQSQGCVTASQAARVLGMTPQGVARLCRTGKLRAHRNYQRRRWDYPIRRPSTPCWQIRIEELARYAGLSYRDAVLLLADPV